MRVFFTIALAACLMTLSLPQDAFADGLSVIGKSTDKEEYQVVSPAPRDYWTLWIHFDKNVAYNLGGSGTGSGGGGGNGDGSGGGTGNGSGGGNGSGNGSGSAANSSNSTEASSATTTSAATTQVEGFNYETFPEDNAAKVYVVRAGTKERISAAHGRIANTREERQVIYVDFSDWLMPLTNYEVVVEPGIVAANGRDTLAEEIRIPFRTNDECPNGLSVAENVLIAGGVLLLIGGVTFGIIRARKQLR